MTSVILALGMTVKLFYYWKFDFRNDSCFYRKNSLQHKKRHIQSVIPTSLVIFDWLQPPLYISKFKNRRRLYSTSSIAGPQCFRWLRWQASYVKIRQPVTNRIHPARSTHTGAATLASHLPSGISCHPVCDYVLLPGVGVSRELNTVLSLRRWVAEWRHHFSCWPVESFWWITWWGGNCICLLWQMVDIYFVMIEVKYAFFADAAAKNYRTLNERLSSDLLGKVTCR